MDDQRTRRRFLCGAAAAALGGLAGCGAPSDTETTPSADESPSATPSETVSETPAATPTATQTPLPTVTPERQPDLGGYLDGAMNYDGDIVDFRGESAVTIDVGVGRLDWGFGPAAVRVDEGTTVTWAWTGEGDDHNVVAEDGTFDSGEPVGAAGTTFEYQFSESGRYRYLCEPHEAQGMKGVVVVGPQ